MSIDQRPGRGFVNIDRCRRVFRLGNYGRRCLRRGCRGGGLQCLELRGKRQLGLLSFVSQLLPQRALLALTLCLLLSTQSRLSFRLRCDPGLLRSRAKFIDGLPQTRHLIVECRSCCCWISRRNEGPGFESLVDEGPVVPNAKLTGYFERRQSLGVVIEVGMCRLISGDPHLVKEVSYL